MENIVTNAVIINKNDKEYLFGEVVQDERYIQGHHILTTEIMSKDLDGDNYKIITKSGTKYNVDKLFDLEGFKKWVSEQLDKSYWESILKILGVA